MKKRARRIALLSGLALFAGPVFADVYGWVDEDGVVHFQDEPPATRRKVKKLETLPGERPRTEAPPAASAPAKGEAGRVRAPSPQQPASAARSVKGKPAPTVELFTTSWCPWCKKARAYFSSRGIKFTDHDIETEAGALRRKLGVDGDKSVPTAIIGGRVIKGYSPSEYQAALELQ